MAQTSRSPRKLWAPIAIGLIALAMIFVVVTSQKTSDTPAATPPEIQEPQRLNMERREANDPLTVGELDAPVALVMYSDFQCGYCALWAGQTLPALLDYVERGDLRIEWRDVAFFGEGSERAALAAAAAGIQGKYLEFNQVAFDGAQIPTAAELSEEGLGQIAEQIGLDVDKFMADLTDPATTSVVQRNIAEASQIGVTSTPTFLLNGLAIVGAQPADVFVNAIEQELASNS